MFLDYDGTLSPIVDDPDRAFMSDAVNFQFLCSLLFHPKDTTRESEREREANLEVGTNLPFSLFLFSFSDQMRAAVRDVARYFPTAIVSGRCRDKVHSLLLAPHYFAHDSIFLLLVSDLDCSIGFHFTTPSSPHSIEFLFSAFPFYVSFFSPFHSSISSRFLLLQVYSFVRLAELYYAGSHGMDIKGPAKRPRGFRANSATAPPRVRDQSVSFRPFSSSPTQFFLTSISFFCTRTIDLFFANLPSNFFP